MQQLIIFIYSIQKENFYQVSHLTIFSENWYAAKKHKLETLFIGTIHLKLERKNVIWKQPDEIDNTIGFETIIWDWKHKDEFRLRKSTEYVPNLNWLFRNQVFASNLRFMLPNHIFVSNLFVCLQSTFFPMFLAKLHITVFTKKSLNQKIETIKTSAITILGRDVTIPDEVIIRNSIVLPGKELTWGLNNQILL